MTAWQTRSYELDNPDLKAIDGLAIYLEQIGRYPRLDAAAEVRLGIAIRAETKANGGKPSASPAFLELFVSNLRLVVSIAKRYQYADFPLTELIQMGNLGLWHAVTKFDPALGFKFSTYADHWIRCYLLQEISQTSRNIRLPRGFFNTQKQIYKLRSALFNEYGFDPSSEQIAARSQIEPELVAACLAPSTQPTLSLDQEVSAQSHDGISLTELTASTAESPEDIALINVMNGELMRHLALLGEREELILRLHFGLGCDDPHTYSEIAQKLNLSPDTVRRRATRALTQLRERMERPAQPDTTAALSEDIQSDEQLVLNYLATLPYQCAVMPDELTEVLALPNAPRVIKQLGDRGWVYYEHNADTFGLVQTTTEGSRRLGLSNSKALAQMCS